METYRSEEEQIEALRRWWQENGRSIVVTVVLAAGAYFGWQGWQGYNQQQAQGASDLYQAMLLSLSEDPAEGPGAMELAERLKSDFGGTTYAQFAALHRAASAVEAGDLAAADSELRWVLARADKGSDVARVAELRLARVVAAAGDTDQALAILAGQGAGAYQAANAVARGDILLAADRVDEAREAYANAQALLATGQVGVNLPSLQVKLAALTPVPPRELGEPVGEVAAPQEAVAHPPLEDGAGEGAP